MPWRARRASRPPRNSAPRLPAALLAALLAAVFAAPAAARATSVASAAPSCFPTRRNPSAALAGSRVTVSPTPGARDASYLTQISFLGVPAAALSHIAVIGSSSGRHTGRLAPYSQGDGGSFLPSRPFDPGETVTVRARLSTSRGVIRFGWSFTVAEPDRAADPGAGTPPPPAKASDYQHFVTMPGITPPTVTVTTNLPQLPPGDLFLAPYSGPGGYGPMIVGPDGRLVWFDQLPHGARAADFRVQRYDGRQVLTWWQDPVVGGSGHGAGIVIANSSYQQIAVVRAGNGYGADLHEFEITPQGSALLTVYTPIRCDLSSVGGPADGALADSIMQEIDLRTGLVMYEWHSIDHVPAVDSYAAPHPASPVRPYDYFHINSIDVTHGGTYLIDARNTWAAYDVSPLTGKVNWALGGRHASFTMGPGTRTAWQHDARELPDGDISFFDNGDFPREHPQTRLIVVAIDYRTRTVRLVSSFQHPSPLLAGSQGDFEALPDGDWVTGWGQVPDFSIFGPTGTLLFDAHLPAGYENYRTYLFPWQATPLTPPALVVRPAAHGSGLVAYASWNGATSVVAWRVLAGASAKTLTARVTQADTGFESDIPLPALSGEVEVQALGAAGQVLGTSAAQRA